MIWTHLNLPYLRVLHSSFSLSGQSVSNRFFIYSYVKLHTHPNCSSTLPRGSWFEQTKIYIIWVCFHASFSFSGQYDFEKKILKRFIYIFLCTKVYPYYGPTYLAIIIWTNLNLPYLRMISHKFKISWLICLWGGRFEKKFTLYMPM